MARFDFLLHHKGAFLVFLLFLLPGFPKDYLCYILGLGHLPLLTFLWIGATGRLLGTIIWRGRRSSSSSWRWSTRTISSVGSGRSTRSTTGNDGCHLPDFMQ